MKLSSFLALALCAACGGTKQSEKSRCEGVVCSASDPCHVAGICDEATGACSNPAQPDGTACAAGSCRAGACVAAASCGDQLRNGDETDVDCGGSCNPCAAGRTCLVAADCRSGDCAGGSCQARAMVLTANPGPNRTVSGGVHVALDGTRSASPAGSITSWSWTQTDGPAVTLAGASTARPSFDAPQVDDAGALLTFALTVTDGAGQASASLDVEVRPPTGIVESTSTGLIFEAMATGALDRDTAVQYLVFAAFGDPRLPAAYARTAQSLSTTAAMHVVVDEFSSLSPEAQAVVQPFLLPPWAPGSWYETRYPRRPAIVGAPAPPPAWATVTTSPHVIVHYPTAAGAGVAQIAASLANEIDTVIWPRLEAYWGAAHMPLDDSGLATDTATNPDGRLDIALLAPADLPLAGGDETPYGTPTPSPAHIRLRYDLPLHGSKTTLGLYESAAHEIFHACQDSYPQHETYATARWIYEATATWAMDYVYPFTNTEQKFAKGFLDTMNLPLDDTTNDRDYGGYLFFQWADRWTEGPEFVKRVWEKYQTLDALDAVDQSFKDSVFGDKVALTDVWGLFLVAAWNRPPNGFFFQEDGLNDGAKEEQAYTPTPNPDDLKSMKATVRHLAGRYYRFPFAGDDARYFIFYDGLGHSLKMVRDEDPNSTGFGNTGFTSDDLPPDARKGIAVRLLGLMNDKWDGWPAIPGAWGDAFAATSGCRDRKATRFEQLVAIFGDGTPKKSHKAAPAWESPRLWVTNVSCYKWSGTATYSLDGNGNGPNISATAASTWGPTDTSGPLSAFLLNEGGSFTVTGSWAEGTSNCTASGGGSITYTRPPTCPTSGTDFVRCREFLGFDGTLLSGPDKRGVTMSEIAPVEYSVTCVDTEGKSTTRTESAWSDLLGWDSYCGGDTYLPAPKVGADGTTLNGQKACDFASRTWSFTASREP